MPDLSPVQLAIALVIALVVLGPKRLPEVGRSLGRGIKEFKTSISGSDAAPDRAPGEHPDAGERLPSAARALGRGLHDLKDEFSDSLHHSEADERPAQPATTDRRGALPKAQADHETGDRSAADPADTEAR